MDSGRRFDPSKYIRTIKTRGGRQEPYLPVPARLLWLRADHPNATVVTEALKLDDRAAVFKATITLPNGGTAMGHGSETAGDFADFIEKAETKAIGRALAALGYGTEFAEIHDDPALAGATEVLPPPAPAAAIPANVPVAAPPPAEPTPPPEPAQPAATTTRPERATRYGDDSPRPERNERTDRAERGERAERGDRTDRTDRTDRFAPPPPRTLGIERAPRPERGDALAAERPIRAARGERAEPFAPPDEPATPPRPTPIERSLRPERVGRARDLAPVPPAETPEPADEPLPPPTPLRRTGRTLTGRTATAATAPAAPVPEPEAPLDAEVTEGGGEGDEPDAATISTTSFWRWARGQGFADRRAVEAAIGRSMETMTPREAFYRLREALARG